MRETLIYLVSFHARRGASPLRLEEHFCRITESQVQTSAPADNPECRTVGCWRTNDEQTDQALEDWLHEWWPADRVLATIEVVRRTPAGAE